MYRPTAVIFSLVSLVPVAFAQDSGGWRKFGTSSGDQAYSVNQAVPPQNSQAPAPGPAQYLPPDVTLPAGTFVRVRINEKLSSDNNRSGDFFTATLTQPLVANGLVIAQPGQNIAGRVSEAVDADHGRGTSHLGLELTELSLVDGQQVPIRTQLMEYQRGNSNGRDAGVMLGTTAAGAAIGAAAGGGVGAGIGAVAGAIAGTIGVAATRGHATEIQPESVLTFRTIDTVNIATDRSGGAFQPVQQQDYRANREQPQPRERAVAPPAPYYGSYGGYYDPLYYPYPYGGYYYGYGPSFGATFVFRGGGGGFRGGGSFRGGGRHR